MKLRGRGIVEGHCLGEALVSRMPISFLGDVNPEKGVVKAKNHDLYGESLKGKVLCFPHGYGSTVGSYVLYSLAKKGLAPKAIVNVKADQVIVVGAVIAEIPMMDMVDIEKINNGEMVEVDAFKGVIKIFRG
ncbi:MAG: DUF126 domain-containing protein [Candidatus Bathyarchaeia archaeon]